MISLSLRVVLLTLSDDICFSKISINFGDMGYNFLFILSFCFLGLMISCGEQPTSSGKAVSESTSDFDLSEVKPPSTNVYATKKEAAAPSKEPKIAEAKGESNTPAKVESTPKRKSAPSPTSKPKPKPKKKLPKITYDSLLYHLPDVIEGDVIHHDIHFTNTGDAPLSISYVKPSCGCTQPSFPFLDIAPGESGVIGVDYHSVGKDGPQMAELTVTTNTIPKTSVVTLEVNVLPKPEE